MIRRLLPILGFIAVFATAGAAVSQTESFTQDVERWLQALDSIEQRVQEDDLAADEIERLRSHVETIQEEARNAKEEIESRLTTPQRELEALGPAPSEQQAQGEEGVEPPAEAPQESASLAARRAQLQEQVTELQGQIKQTELVITRAQEVLRHLSSISSQRFTQELLARGPSPLNPETWGEAFAESKHIVADLLANPGEWWRTSGPRAKGWTPWLVSLVVGFVVAAILLLLRRWLTGRYGRKREIEAPSFSRRTLAAAVDGFTGGLGPSLALAAFAGLLEHFDLANHEANPLLYGVGWGLIVYWVVGELVRAVFAPRAPQWRLVPFSSEISRLLGLQCQGLTLYLAIVTAIFVAIRGDAGMDELDPSFRACFMLVINSLTAFFLSFLLGGWLWRPHAIQTEHVAEEPDHAAEEPEPAEEESQGAPAGSYSSPSCSA